MLYVFCLEVNIIFNISYLDQVEVVITKTNILVLCVLIERVFRC